MFGFCSVCVETILNRTRAAFVKVDVGLAQNRLGQGSGREVVKNRKIAKKWQISRKLAKNWVAEYVIICNFTGVVC